MRKGFQHTALSLFCLTLFLGPLLPGAVQPYGSAVLALLVFISFLLVLRTQLKRDFGSGKTVLTWTKSGMNLLFGTMLLFLVGQILFAAPYVYPVRVSLLRWCLCGALFLGLMQTLGTRRRVEAVFFCILSAALLRSASAVLQAGGYEYTEDFVLFLTLAFCLAAAWGAVLAEEGHRPDPQVAEQSRRAIFARWVSAPFRFRPGPLVLLSLVLVPAALFLSGSPWGTGSALAGVSAMAIFVTGRPGKSTLPRRGLALLLVLVLAATVGTIILAVQSGTRTDDLQTMSQTQCQMQRGNIRFLREAFPLTGVGLGNLESPFAGLAREAGATETTACLPSGWNRFLAEAGFVGVGLFLAGALVFLAMTLKTWISRRDIFVVVVGALPFSAAGCAALFAFSGGASGFPTSAFTLAALLATGTSTLHIQRRKAADKDLLPRYRWPLFPVGGLLFALAVFGVAGTGLLACRDLLAQSSSLDADRCAAEGRQVEAIAHIRNAIRWNNGNAAYWYELADLLKKQELDLLVSGELTYGDRASPTPQEPVREALEQATALNPLSPAYQSSLAWAFLLRPRGEADTEALHLAADRAMDQAATLAQGRYPSLQRDMGNYWLLRSKSLSPIEESYDAAMERAKDHYAQALTLVTPDRRTPLREEIAAFVWNLYPHEGFRKRLLGE